MRSSCTAMGPAGPRPGDLAGVRGLVARMPTAHEAFPIGGRRVGGGRVRQLIALESPNALWRGGLDARLRAGSSLCLRAASRSLRASRSGEAAAIALVAGHPT